MQGRVGRVRGRPVGRKTEYLYLPFGKRMATLLHVAACVVGLGVVRKKEIRSQDRISVSPFWQANGHIIIYRGLRAGRIRGHPKKQRFGLATERTATRAAPATALCSLSAIESSSSAKEKNCKNISVREFADALCYFLPSVNIFGSTVSFIASDR